MSSVKKKMSSLITSSPHLSRHRPQGRLPPAQPSSLFSSTLLCHSRHGLHHSLTFRSIASCCPCSLSLASPSLLFLLFFLVLCQKQVFNFLNEFGGRKKNNFLLTIFPNNYLLTFNFKVAVYLGMFY